MSWPSRQSLLSLRHGDKCREDQADDKLHQWHQHRDQSEWTEAWESDKIEVPGLGCNRRGVQAWDTLQDSRDDGSLDKVKTTLRNIPLNSKIRLTCSLVTFIFLYACKPWTLIAELQRRKQAIKMMCYRKILCISCKGQVINEEVSEKIQQAIELHEDLTIVKRHKLKWCGYVSRSSGLAKTILQGTMKGRRRQGRQKKRWEDNTRVGQAWCSPNPREQRRLSLIHIS